jgi:hypothetical protein
MIRLIPHPAAWLCVVCALASAPRARAGTVLLSRESDLRASGASAGGEYDLSNGTADLSDWSDRLLSDDGAPARSSARQHSAPSLGKGGAFSGAAAEGSARASVDAGVDDAFSDAATDFDLFFTVSDRSALLKIDGTLAAGGDATAGVLVRRATGQGDPVLALDVSERSQAVNESAVLVPGTYGLSVWAFARGTPDESAASYAVTMTLTDAQAGGTPMPLPAAAWAGAAGLSAVALLVTRARRKLRNGPQ